MKFLKSFFLLTLFSTGVLLTSTGCDDDDVDPANIEFQFNYKVNGVDYQEGDVYDINGTAVTFTQTKFYVGGIEFTSDKGDVNAVDGLHILVDPATNGYAITELDAGNYSTLSFFLGVGLEENNQSELDFTNRPSDDPLAAQDPSMNWPWGAGYKFVRVDGLVDLDGDGTPETKMEFHLGDPDPTDQDPRFRKDLEFTLLNDMASGDNTINFNIDLAQLFIGIDLSTNYLTHVGDNIDLANAFFGNLDKVFSVE
ncbi:MAG: hypothetical protein P1U70_16275 [Saprospiraceae bacterium]|jgi:hypothetical protein|nr:hypothetical protein [Saprospiraceae bacterium]